MWLDWSSDLQFFLPGKGHLSQLKDHLSKEEWTLDNKKAKNAWQASRFIAFPQLV